MYNHDEGSIEFYAKLPSGATIQLTEAVRARLIESTKKTIQEHCSTSPLKNTVAALCFSCAIRRNILGTMTPEELKIVTEHVPDCLPIMGFYSFGELSPLKIDGYSQLHNATLVTLLIGIKDEANPVQSCNPVRTRLVPELEETLSLDETKYYLRFLKKKLDRKFDAMQKIEHNKEQNVSLLRTISQEIDQARLEIKESQKKLALALKEVETANKNVMDSIQYAKLIQVSLLPDVNELREKVPNGFLIWMPRDIVGGDICYAGFYDNGWIVCMIDCTGHGVPGAFMTMVASSGMRRIVDDEKLRDPGQILKKLNHVVKTTLQQDKDIALSDDGLDAAIAYVSPDRDRLVFSGAKLPLYIVENGKTRMIKGDRQSIGYKKSKLDFEYTNHEIKVEKGMSFYMSTDGFLDQLGGEKNRLFGRKRFIETLEKAYPMKFDDQQKLLETVFKEHKGDHDRQDDVTVIGFNLESDKI